MISSIPNYFNNSETPIICYKYNKPIRSAIFNFNKIVTDINIDSNTAKSRDSQNSNYLYPPAGHAITGNLKVIPDARVRNIISKVSEGAKIRNPYNQVPHLTQDTNGKIYKKGPKYRFPSNTDFPKCRRDIAASLNDISNRWCNRENVSLMP